MTEPQLKRFICSVNLTGCVRLAILAENRDDAALTLWEWVDEHIDGAVKLSEPEYVELLTPPTVDFAGLSVESVDGREMTDDD